MKDPQSVLEKLKPAHNLPEGKLKKLVLIPVYEYSRHQWRRIAAWESDMRTKPGRFSALEHVECVDRAERD